MGLKPIIATMLHRDLETRWVCCWSHKHFELSLGWRNALAFCIVFGFVSETNMVGGKNSGELAPDSKSG